jgi:hypothetical protein
MLQNINFTRPELHVETEQRKYLVSIAIGLRHMEQTAKGAPMPAAYGVLGQLSKHVEEI